MRKVPIPQVQDFVYGNGQPSRHGCLQSQDNWPRQLGRITGVPIDDFSCTADPSHTIPTRVNWAIGSGTIHCGTRAVVISVGINDFRPYGMARGADPLNPGKVRSDYVNNIRTAVNKARAAAPGAKIIIAGTLSISDPGPLNTLSCRSRRPRCSPPHVAAPDEWRLTLHGGDDLPPRVGPHIGLELRRRRDLNPRRCDPRWFSRPVHSAALPRLPVAKQLRLTHLTTPPTGSR